MVGGCWCTNHPDPTAEAMGRHFHFSLLRDFLLGSLAGWGRGCHGGERDAAAVAFRLVGVTCLERVV